MKIHYLSCHETLEWLEVSLLVEMGHTVFANGAYLDPKGHLTLKRPGIPNGEFFPEYVDLATRFPQTNLPPELIEPFDLIWISHTPTVVTENWDRIKHKKVLWRSIGQSTKHVENTIRRMRYEGMKIVRMSPLEKQIDGYIGDDAIIRFHADPDEFHDWNGNTKRAINITQSLLGRRVYCHYDSIMQTLNGFPFLIYGSGNNDLGNANGGELPFDLMKGVLRDSRAFVYGGTWPSPYSLSFIEAMITGIPIVALGKKLAEELPGIAEYDRMKYYEIPDIIANGHNGFVSDSINDLRTYLHQLLEDQGLAKQIGQRGRETAIQLFGKEKVKKQWQDFLNTI